MQTSGVRLAAFDLDGTLTRGESVAEAIARGIDRSARMQQFEALTDEPSLTAGRIEMASWFAPYSPEQLCGALPEITLAPGAREGIALLQRAGVEVAIVSITWEFAVAWYARLFHVRLWAGTALQADGGVLHFWPRDKGRWLREAAARLAIGTDAVAAAGDSWRDLDLLQAAGRAYYVGAELPAGLEHAVHVPSGDITEVARLMLAR